MATRNIKRGNKSKMLRFRLFAFRKNPKKKIFFSFLKKIWARDIKKM